jgi:serine/threonine-protein kinase Chk1
MVVGSAYDLPLPGSSDISSDLEDTPWDEPTEHSSEFNRYVAGSFIDDAPWDQIPAPVFCSSSILIPFLTSLTHPWVALITGLLTINPQDRMTLANAAQHPWVVPYVR